MLPGEKARTKLFDSGDLIQVVLLILLLPVAWLLPERRWQASASAIGRLFARGPLGNRVLRHRVARRFAVAGQVGARPDKLAERQVSAVLLARLQLLRLWRDPSWRPDVEFEGLEHLQAARSAPGGAILWLAPFTHADLVGKIALAGEGFDILHLGRPEHGFSGSRFGMAVLNPLQIRIERRFLAARIEMTGALGVKALRSVKKALRRGLLVTISLTRTAKQVRPVAFLGARIELPVGPVNLAFNEGAALIPVHIVESAPGLFRVVIRPPLELPADGDREARVDAVLGQFVAGLEDLVVRYPEQWRGWNLVVEDR
ncbi:lipid A biosynthesis lauroyl acyltransferase [Oceanibacterium hippocampi]|uniref:Lipid A biosynthesis lauroyl acyltransferase n=1 Tax=Oceanibacterium hippocampi TaxID=745714 RepID=A0A1Y5T1S8_9PROT|nr:lipid A biosynthesis lauroyl acyltransferase [Oceanibacterium hippocampi]